MSCLCLRQVLRLPARFPPFIWVGDGSTTMTSLPCEGGCLDGRFVPPRLCQNIGLAALAPRGPTAGDTEDQDHQGGQAAAGVPEALLPSRVRHPQRLSGQTDLCTVSTLGPCCLQVLPSLELNQTLPCNRPRPRVRAARHSRWFPSPLPRSLATAGSSSWDFPKQGPGYSAWGNWHSLAYIQLMGWPW